MRSNRLVACALLAAWCGLGTAVRAHTGVRAVIGIEPSPPVAGEACAVTVRFETRAGAPVQVDARQVRLVAEMTGHAMPPVVVTLDPVTDSARRDGEADRPRAFRGAVEFTMAGPWRITVSTEAGHDTITGVFELAVGAESRPVVAAEPVSVDMAAPVAPQAIPAWPILLAAVGLTIGLEAAAIARRLAVARRQRRSTGGTAPLGAP